MRVVSWNVRGASKKKKEVWDFLLALQPDVALLQEVGDIPAQVSDEFDCLIRPAVTEDGRNQRFHTGVLAKGEIIARDFISDSEDLNRQFEFFRGNWPASHQRPPLGSLGHLNLWRRPKHSHRRGPA